MRRKVAGVVLGVVAAGAAGCGGTHQHNSVESRPSTVTSQATGTQAGGGRSSAPAAKPAPARPATAVAVYRALKDAGLPVRLTADYTASTDPNGLLGRPSGYRSKVNFADARIDPSAGATRDDLMLGGSVEVWPDGAGALKRARYIAAIGAPIANEYDYVAGPVLLRVSGNLTPAQAAPYAHALTKVLGTAVKLVTPSS